MHVFESLTTLDPAQTVLTRPVCCSLGMFDGVHVGHQMVLERAVKEARFRKILALVFSFANHPQHVLAKTPVPLLSTLGQRLEHFRHLGFDAAWVPPFDPKIQAMSARDFVQNVLVERLKVAHITVGYDFRFGSDRLGDTDFLTDFGKRQGFSVEVVPPVRVDHQVVSSTLIRKLLSYGNVAEAARLLGQVYAVTGTVQQGFQRGRALGFPTANIVTQDPSLLIPANGTYAGYAWVRGAYYPAVCNVGQSPTFDDPTPKKRVEVHLMDYHQAESLYNETLGFAFCLRLRDEQRFPSVDHLVRQIHQDCHQTVCWWEAEGQRQFYQQYSAFKQPAPVLSPQANHQWLNPVTIRA
ncbi:MAG: riboflavin biosynthesis protein RibF [Candidatus Melainabacteria bacterium]|nr:riboflavin biosynthesis protein RibF [Candidatus Melainabacteria bacterium]